MHELKQLVDHGLEELPVGTQELGVLADNVPATRPKNPYALFNSLCDYSKLKPARHCADICNVTDMRQHQANHRCAIVLFCSAECVSEPT